MSFLTQPVIINMLTSYSECSRTFHHLDCCGLKFNVLNKLFEDIIITAFSVSVHIGSLTLFLTSVGIKVGDVSNREK